MVSDFFKVNNTIMLYCSISSLSQSDSSISSFCKLTLLVSG